MKKLLIGLFFLTSTLSYADSLSLTIHLDVMDFYRIDADRTQLYGKYSTTSGDVSLVVASGNVGLIVGAADEQITHRYKEVIPETERPISTQKMEIMGEIGGNKVRLVLKDKIDTMVPANIKKSEDQLASFTIASEDIMTALGKVYTETYEREWVGFLRNLSFINIDLNNASVNYLETSDLVCTEIATELLVCTSSVEIIVDAIERW